MRLFLAHVLFIGLCVVVVVNGVPFVKEDAAPQCGYQSCHPVKEGYINVHLVPHTHDDVGWLKTVDQYFYGANFQVQSAAVQYILDTVVDSLQKNPDRRFIYVETAFFWMWWNKQNDETKTIVKNLVNNGQLEFIGGGWSMNDEAVTHYQSTIDQMTWGLRRLNETFGSCAVPKVAWQIDPFGHSREMANLFKQIGFDAFILNRIDYQDKSQRANNKELEFIWKGGDFAEINSNIFTSILLKHYNPPSGLCFDINCQDDSIVDDPESPEYNVNIKLDYFFTHVNQLVNSYKTNNVLVTMGDDFSYQNADRWYVNLDKLINLVNSQNINGYKFNAIYSTPSCYIKAVYDETEGKISTSQKTDDFFPYASDQNSYWTGYYSSREALKRYERLGNNFLQVCKQLTSLTGLNSNDTDKLNLLREAMGILQHHDAITGTEKLVVAMDYARLLHKGIASCEELTYSALNKYLKVDNEESQKEEVTDLPDLQLTTCPLTNLSQCEVSEKSEAFVVTLYNPLGISVDKFVRLPVNGTAYRVTDPEGNTLVTDLIPVPQSILALPGRNSSANVELTFLATQVPALGFKSYFIEKIEGDNLVKQDNSTAAANSTFVGIQLDPKTGFLSHIQVNGTYYEVSQSLWYYVGNFLGATGGISGRSSGAYVFRPVPNDTLGFMNVTDKTEFYEIYSGELVTEVHQVFSNWTSQIIRIYKNENFVEFDWVIGAADTGNGLPEVSGREYVSKFETNLNNSKTFYTDTNGRHAMLRTRDYRSSFNAVIDEKQAGNYYPVVSKLLLRDVEKNVEFAVMTDRAQGGSSLKDGELELMIYRNCLTDDGFGVGEPLVELQYGYDISVRGSHYVFIGEGGIALKRIEREVEMRKLFDSWIYLAPADGYTFETYKESYRMEFSGVQQSLPYSVHLLTLEPWTESTLLLRLEHLNLVSDAISVDIQNLFSTFTLKSIKETTLGANQWLEDSNPLEFTQVDSNGTAVTEEKLQLKPVTDDPDNVYTITLTETQIRTFVVEIEY